MSSKIAYQNKDIEFKLLSESFKERSFEAYGLKLPRIKEVLPTNLPEVSANEMRMDNLFRLEDDTLAIVDYESDNKAHNRIKYINYIGRVMERWYQDRREIPNIRLIVIYTGDITKADAQFHMECMTLRMEQVFVRDLPAEEIYQTVTHKLEQKAALTEQELMQLIILPLAEKGAEKKQERIEQVISLADRIENEQEQKLVLSGLLVVSDKFISKENSDSIRRQIGMTKIGRMLFEDGLEEGMEKGIEKGMEKGMEKGRKEVKRRTAENMLRDGLEWEKIKKYTDLTDAEIREIEKEMLVSQ